MKSNLCVVCQTAPGTNNPYPLVNVEGRELERGDKVCSACDQGVISLRSYFMESGICSGKGDSYGPPLHMEKDGTLWYKDSEGNRIDLPFTLWEPYASAGFLP